MFFNRKINNFIHFAHENLIDQYNSWNSFYPLPAAKSKMTVCCECFVSIITFLMIFICYRRGINNFLCEYIRFALVLNFVGCISPFSQCQLIRSPKLPRVQLAAETFNQFRNEILIATSNCTDRSCWPRNKLIYLKLIDSINRANKFVARREPTLFSQNDKWSRKYENI